jgi:NAD+ kinase
MKIALFGRNFNDSFNSIVYDLLKKFSDNKITVTIFEPLEEYLLKEKKFAFTFDSNFTNTSDLPCDTELLMSIGGDGTFLEAITFIRNKGIPIIGINAGRLGFLANIGTNEVSQAIDNLIQKKYIIEERPLIKLSSQAPLFDDFPYALNEFTIQKTGSSLIAINVLIDNEYLTTYWSDGLIVSTPTGSTAYSLSLGGPLVTPASDIFIITPIAAHNLNVRPLVLPNNATLKITASGRTDLYLTTLDSRSAKCDIGNEITLSKSDFKLKIVKLPDISFYSTLRNKLMWGADKRN